MHGYYPTIHIYRHACEAKFFAVKVSLMIRSSKGKSSFLLLEILKYLILIFFYYYMRV